MKNVAAKKKIEDNEKLKELQMMRKEDMSLGQLFDFARMFPEDLDGFLFEQKINRTISEEFIRIQARVDSAHSAVSEHTTRMNVFEEKVEIVRAQMSRIGKFDGAIDAFH